MRKNVSEELRPTPVSGKAAKRFYSKTKELTKEQKEFLDDCIKVLEAQS